jgi:DNA-binding transcriptional ArsR family regulator
MDLVKTRILELLQSGPRPSLALAQALGVSGSTVQRAIRVLERDGLIARLGKTRGAQYARLRPVAALGSSWPVYRIDEAGRVHELGGLEAVERDGYYVTGGPARVQRFFEGIPYFLQDVRPGGFLGRAVPAAYPELGLPPRVVDWTDVHFLVYLTRRATDAPGALVVGTESMDRYLSGARLDLIVAENERAKEYPRFAAAAMAGAPPGSSTQGEHPKFTMWIGNRERRQAAIVKFSPPLSTATGRRWGDLLLAEHLAHGLLNENGIPACQSEILEYGDRVFLQCQRFDRVGVLGRRSVVSLHAVDTWRYGQLDSWTASAARLATDGLLSAEEAERIQLLDTFGALTANTDRHFGNITLFDDYEGALRLAPVYDMLPMLFAPQNDQIVPRQFEPGPLRAAWLPVWARARSLAQAYWERLSSDKRLSGEFRELCTQALKALGALTRVAL